MDLDEAAARLRQLEREGRLTAERVVEDARDPTSPLHRHFEWDDAEAAHQYRIGQARLLIRRIQIEVPVREVPIKVAQYVRDPEERETYRNILTVRSEEDTSRRVVIDAMMRVVNAAKSARAVATVLGTEGDITGIIRLAETVIRRASAADPHAGTA